MSTANPTADPQEGIVLKTDIAGLSPYITGKVRDVYDLDYELLVVATDRISAYDSVLPTGIPDKGRVLNQLSAFWFRRIQNICPSHFITTEQEQIEAALSAQGVKAPMDVLAGRSMLVNKARALPAEFVVRGYIDGSAWKEYQESGAVCGIKLPAGLQRADRLPEPILTPATKATTGHDINITHEELMELGEPGHIQSAVEQSLEVYKHAHAYALDRGIIIADTKFEFGVFESMTIIIDECLTPDSSRFWDAATYKPGGTHYSLDKQFVRDYLDTSGWDHEPPAPELPRHIVQQTARRYRDIFERLTGMELE